MGDEAVAESLSVWASASVSERVATLARIARLEQCPETIELDDLTSANPMVSVRVLRGDFTGDGLGDAIALVEGLCNHGGMNTGFVVRVEGHAEGPRVTDCLFVGWASFEPFVELDTAHARLWVELGLGHGSGYEASSVNVYDVSEAGLEVVLSAPLNLDNFDDPDGSGVSVRGQVRVDGDSAKIDYRVTKLEWSEEKQEHRPRSSARGFVRYKWEKARFSYASNGGKVSQSMLARWFELED